MCSVITMATNSDRVKDGLKDLQQEITCPLCLDTFEDPRLLPCQHVYCKTCLDYFASQGGGASLECPECRKTPQLAGGVAGLPTAFHINRLKEVVAKMMLEGEERVEKVIGTVESDRSTTLTGEPEGRGSVSTCSHHPRQFLDLYCRRCEKLICRDCIFLGTEHINHPYDKVEVIIKDCHKQVRRELVSLLQKKSSITKAMADICTARQMLVENCKMISSKITESYDRVMSVARGKKETELHQLQSEADARLKEMETRKAVLTDVLSEVNAMQSLVEGGTDLEEPGDVEFMAQCKERVLKINQIHRRINSLPMSQPEASLHAQVIDLVLRTYTTVDPALCTVEVTKDNGHVQVGAANITSILLKDSEGHPCPLQQYVTMELCPPRFGESVTTEVVSQSASRYEACYTPTLSTRGNCQLIVKVNGHMIGNGPIEVFIECPPQLLGEPVQIIDGIRQPSCLKILNGQMLCITQSAGIHIVDLNNTTAPPTHSDMFPKTSRVQRWKPSEIAIDKEFNVIYVSDSRNNMIHKFKMNGQYLMSTGQKGSSPGEFNRVNGLCVSSNGALYVCDSDNHRIQVFDRDLQLLQCFGFHGTAPGRFNWPDNIGCDSSGHLYVTDRRNHRIQCITAEGDAIRCIGEGSGPGGLIKPSILCVLHSRIFVTDGNMVSVFTTGGQYITHFAAMYSAIITNGLAVDNDGFVYVADASCNRIIVF